MSMPRPLRLFVVLQTVLLLVAASAVLYGPAGQKAVALGFIAAQILLVLGIGALRRLAVIGYAAVLLASTFYVGLTFEEFEPVDLLLQLLVRGAILFAVIPYWSRFR